ncbi:hypothetical protein WME89_49555 [Sorangium sp. So ce321]|uniref:hypothetical protein n=1 Tax=Sorangium sp. So ce321 TaxID=3133300 RepID=UPI003F63DBF0
MVSTRSTSSTSSRTKRKRTSGKQGNSTVATSNSTGRSRRTTAVNAVTKRRRVAESGADSSPDEVASRDSSESESSDSDDEESSQRSRIDSGLVQRYNNDDDQEDESEGEGEGEEREGDSDEEEGDSDEEEGDSDEEEGEEDRRERPTSTRQQLDGMAETLNLAIHGDGRLESRNVQAVVQTDDGTYVIFTQREYRSFDEAIEGIEGRHRITIDDRIIGDNPREDENIHAEMLAVSWWLQGHIRAFNRIGVSRAVCARCAAVLAHYGIQHRPTDSAMTQNWVHPYRHADLDPSGMAGPLRALPQKVTKGKEYGW